MRRPDFLRSVDNVTLFRLAWVVACVVAIVVLSLLELRDVLVNGGGVLNSFGGSP